MPSSNISLSCTISFSHPFAHLGFSLLQRTTQEREDPFYWDGEASVPFPGDATTVAWQNACEPECWTGECWRLNWNLLLGPPCSLIHGELLALSGMRACKWEGGHHTVMFLLWNYFNFLSLPPPMWTPQPPLYFGWVCHSHMTNLLPIPSEGSRARTQPSHLLDQQQAPLSPIPFVIIKFLTDMKDKWKVLLFYNHQFSAQI